MRNHEILDTMFSKVKRQLAIFYLHVLDLFTKDVKISIFTITYVTVVKWNLSMQSKMSKAVSGKLWTNPFLIVRDIHVLLHKLMG